MQGKHILITGATSGIGLAAAQALAALSANVAIVGRNETRTRVAAAAIGAAAKAATVTTFVPTCHRGPPCASWRPRCWRAVQASMCW